MKYVKCIYKSGGVYLTVGKIYEVITLFKVGTEDYIQITNDRGLTLSFAMKRGNKEWFVDMTVEVRDNKINEILGWN